MFEDWWWLWLVPVAALFWLVAGRPGLRRDPARSPVTELPSTHAGEESRAFAATQAVPVLIEDGDEHHEHPRNDDGYASDPEAEQAALHAAYRALEEETTQKEEERLAAEAAEAARRADLRHAAAEREAAAEQEAMARRAAEEAERIAADRIAADRRAAAQQRAAEQQQATERARAELERRAAELEAARIEAARVESARIEAARAEAARQDAARREAARLEAARVEATRREAEREEALRRTAEREELARRAEAEQRARQDAERIAAARLEAERQALAEAQAEAERRAAEAARAEAERQAAEVAAAEAAAAEAARIAAEAACAAAAAPPRRIPEQTLVMIADDSKVVRVKTSRLLAQQRYRVVLAEHGQHALDQIAAEAPQVLITDVEMPVMDGFELTRRVRAHAATAQVPVIMITSADDRLRDAASEAGVTVLLGKPYPEEELLAHIARLAGVEAPTAVA